VCSAALLALKGARVQVSDIRRHAGDSSRGLTIRQVRDVLRACGGAAEAIAFDTTRVECIPLPAIVLLERGHYVVVARRSGDKLTVFYPEFGWTRISFAALGPQLSPYAVALETVDTAQLPARTRRRFSAVLAAGLRAHALRPFVLHALFIVLAQGLLLWLPTVTGSLIDANGPSTELKSFGGAAIVYVVVTCITGLISSGGIFLAQKISQTVGLSMGERVFAALERKQARWFETLPTDGVRNALGSTDSVVRLMNTSSTSLLTAFTSLTIATLALWSLSPWMLAICAPLVALTGLIDFLAERRLLGAAIRLFESGQRKGRFIGDSLSQFPLFQRMGKLDALKVRYIETLRSAVESEAAMNVRRSMIASASSLVKAVDLLCFSFLASILMKNGVLSVGGFVAAGAYKVALTQAAASLISLHGQFRAISPNIQQADDLLAPDAPASEGEVVGDQTPASGGAPVIMFDKVAFRYGPFDQPVLAAVDLAVGVGEFVVIAGPSGCGKTTIAKLIAGAEAPTSGKVLVGGRPSKPGMHPVSLVLQTDRLIDGSIRDNISLFEPDVPTGEIFRALEIVCLDDFVKSLPMGLLTGIGEGRGGISAGQRQRLLLARAVLARPDIFVLDEATSNLDIQTEARILTFLRATGAAILLIAHRPEAWSGADRIYDLVDGSLQRRPDSETRILKANGKVSELSA
jgi:ATP-binding cassette subfamily B protein RaxB